MIALLESTAASIRSAKRGGDFVVVTALLVVLSLTYVMSWDPVVVAVCCLFGMPIVLSLTKGSDESYMADTESGTYVRLTGPIHLCVVEHEEDGAIDYSVQLDGEDFPISLLTFQALQQVTWASIDYAPCSRTMFALREESGQVLWQHPNYLSDATSASPADRAQRTPEVGSGTRRSYPPPAPLLRNDPPQTRFGERHIISGL
jgi:hypothetical protein